jgi:hypothetical protein
MLEKTRVDASARGNGRADFVCPRGAGSHESADLSLPNSGLHGLLQVLEQEGVVEGAR